jgi:hypothetical protein
MGFPGRPLGDGLLVRHGYATENTWYNPGMSFREVEYYSRRCEQTNRQLLKAIESLARVRRLLTPMQINIGQNQVNVTQ